MHGLLRENGARSSTTRSSRSSSIDSDALHHPIASGMKPVPSAKPAPAYVAAAAASELVTNTRQMSLDDDASPQDSPSTPPLGETALFSIGGLAMINAFLDQLLYNFLAHSRGATLAALRQSVEQVLKGKLASYAIASADEELEELLNDEEMDETLVAVEESASDGPLSDIEAVFWRTRLRVMVYMRLGELEDEDEEAFVEDAQSILQRDPSKKRVSLNTGLVSWAAAIFLTSVLEFIAEQSLNVAGQAAFDRVASKRKHKSDNDSNEDERVMVAEHDTEKIALSSALGRLWRTWRKSVRSPHSRNVSGATSYFGPRKSSLNAHRHEQLISPRLEGHSRKASEKTTGGTNVFINQRGAHSQVERLLGPSHQANRVDSIRIHRLSQRPRSLIIQKANPIVDDAESISTQRTVAPQQDQIKRMRSKSLPSLARNPVTPLINQSLPRSDRPRTAPKFESESINDDVSAEPAVPNLRGAVPCLDNSQYVNHNTRGTTQPVNHAASDSVPAQAGQAESFVGSSHVARKSVPINKDQPLNPGVPTATHERADSRESYTSIEEDYEPEPPTPIEEPTKTNTRGLGIRTAPVSRGSPRDSIGNVRSPQVTSQYAQPTHYSSGTRSAPRSPPYQGQIIRTAKSFDREDKPSVRRLSNTSSKYSKSNGSTPRFPTKPSLEALSSKSTTSHSGNIEKGFGDFVAGNETVKYTLTPRTLQEIESQESSRYVNRGAGGDKTGNQKRQFSEHELEDAQKAVIASLNASLKTYSSRDNKTHASPASATSISKSHPPVPPVPRTFTSESASFRTSDLSEVPTEAKMDNAMHPSRSNSTQHQVPPHEKVTTINPHVSPSKSNPPIGWFSARASLESSRAAHSIASSSSKSQQSAALGQKKSNTLLKPREAIVTRGRENDELIAFLKSTSPPGVQVYRGSTKAPSGESSTISPAASSWAASVHESLNSHKDLLPKKTMREQPKTWNSPTTPATNEAGPVRTRHRNLDPYALPSDDEEDDGLTALPRNHTETLIDFLRSVEPPAHVTSPNGAGGGGRADPRDLLNLSGNAEQGRVAKSKGSVKAFWKKIGA